MGVLADHELRDMIARGEISAAPEIIDAQIQPASIDLRLGTRTSQMALCSKRAASMLCP